MITSLLDQLPIYHLAIFFYLLSGQTYLINTFLMPVLENISQKYKFTETGTGVLVALGISIPELTTNLLSCATFKNEMIGYGFGAIVGSGVFDFTICFGVMSIVSFNHHKKPIKLKLGPLLRDIYIYLITLLYLGLVFWDYEISISEALILILFYPVYLIYSFNKKSTSDKFDSALNHQDQDHPSALNFAYDKFKHNPYEVYLQDYNLKDQTDQIQTEDDLEGEVIGETDQQEMISDQIDSQKVPLLLYPFHFIFNLTLPVQNQPELAFGIITIYCFLIVQFSIQTVDEVVEVVQVGHAFVGLTIASWAGNISDVLNASIAAKNKKTELATSSIIGSQIMNLQICLGVPWLITILIHQQNIIFYDKTIFVSVQNQQLQKIIAIFVVVIISLLLMLYSGLKLSYSLGIQLIAIYVVYFCFEWKNNSL